MHVVTRRSGLLVLAAALLAGCGPKVQPHYAPELSSPTAPASAPATNKLPPLGIRIPSIEVNNRQFMRVGLITHPDGSSEMEVPPLNQPKLIGFYDLSSVPGDDGVSVLESHVNGNGQQGGFAKLDSVKVGDSVEIDRADHQTAVFKVVKSLKYLKADYSKHKSEIFGDTDHPALRLITCTGDLGPAPVFYKSQRVIFADLVTLKPTGP